MAPKGVPDQVVTTLKAALKESLKDPQLRKTFDSLGGLPMADDEDVAKVMRDDTARYRKFVDATKLDTQK
jgi:tripartite-type tricarboxylate transporter receptor subunit TctC